MCIRDSGRADGFRAGAEVRLPGRDGGGDRRLGAQCLGGVEGGDRVEESVAAGVVAAAGRGVGGGVLQELLDLGRGQVRVRGPDQGHGSGDEGGGGAGAPALVVGAVGVGDDDVDAGGADAGVPVAGGEGRLPAAAVDGGDGDDAGVGGRVGGVVAVAAAVARGGDHDDALGEGVLDGLVLGGLVVGGGAVVAEREVDHVGAVVGGPADALGEGGALALTGLGAARVALFEDHADREDPRLRGDAEDALAAVAAVAVPGDDPGHGGAVAGPGGVAGAGAQADEVGAFEDLSGEVGVAGVDAGVEDGDGDPVALGDAPGLLGAQGRQAPLAVTDGVGGGRGRGGAGEDGAECEGCAAGPDAGTPHRRASGAAAAGAVGAASSRTVCSTRSATALAA